MSSNHFFSNLGLLPLSVSELYAFIHPSYDYIFKVQVLCHSFIMILCLLNSIASVNYKEANLTPELPYNIPVC